ncbi:hypothetical protein AB0I98_13690 [Streptomyces sp. NPDC050211]
MTTTNPWLASSSTSTVPQLRGSPAPGEYSTTGRRPPRGSAGASR